MPGGPSPPAEVIATWPAPNYVNPVRHNAALTVICCVFGSLSFLTVGARLWARFQIQHNPGLDDWLMIGALVPMSGLLVIVGIGKSLDLGSVLTTTMKTVKGMGRAERLNHKR